MDNRLNMCALLCSPTNLVDIEKVLNDKDIQVIAKIIDEDVLFRDFKNTLMSISVGYVIIDLDAIADLDEYIKELKRYKLYGYKSTIKIILMTRKPEVPEVKRAISRSINLGVYNVIAPLEGEELDIVKLLNVEIDAPGELKRVARWFEEEDEVVTESQQKQPTASNEKVKIIEKEKVIGTVVVAVAGAGQKHGCTHTALTMARYLVLEGHSVAIVETNTSNVFKAIRDLNTESQANRDSSFKLNGLTYYYNGETSVAGVLEKDYSFVILDLGQYKNCLKEEYRRAHIKIMVSASKDWEIHHLTGVLKEFKEQNVMDKSKYLFTLSSKAEFEELSKNMINLECVQVPICPDLEELDKEAKVFCRFILEQYLPKKLETQEVVSIGKVNMAQIAQKLDVKALFKRGGK